MNSSTSNWHVGHPAHVSLDLLIIDGDFSSAIDLKTLLVAHGYYRVRRCTSAAAALAACARQRPNLVLLDAGPLGTISGIDFAWKLKQQEIPILFITDLKGEATYYSALTTLPLGYLVKPVSSCTLHSVLSMAGVIINKSRPVASETVEEAFGMISAINRNVLHKVRLAEVQYIKAGGTFCELYTEGGTYVINQPIKDLEERLSGRGFFRCHRQYIVRIDKILTLRWEERVLEVGSWKIPLSRRKGGEMRRLFLNGQNNNKEKYLT
jgi:DNA-binding LytR/AlgR family response regulator